MNTPMSRRSAERLITRSLTFLRCLSRRRRIRAVLRARGYSAQVHRDGWSAWKAVVGADGLDEPEPGEDLDKAMSALMAELDAWDEPNLAVASAALKTSHPAQHTFVFNNLSAGQREDSQIAIETFLDRLTHLESGEGRPEDQREADQAALAKLSSRGITTEERARLRSMLDQLANLDDEESDEQAPATLDETLQRDLAALDGWFNEWSEIARALITRRDYLIALGLAKPRRREPTEEEE